MSIKAEIAKLKSEKKAVILAHYYVSDEIQEIADYIGDSFYLSKIATTVDADIIVFCGVSFMGESAKILNPTKKVLMPDMSADCPMAHMVDIAKIEELKAQYDDLAVVCYINSTATIKTYSDVCVTSANAIKIVKNMPNQHIFFIPDGNLGRYVSEQVPEKTVILNTGYCPIHNAMPDVAAAKAAHPDAQFVVHPECQKSLLDEADYIGSTSGIIDYVKDSSCKEFIVGTEIGVMYELKKQNPDKKFYTLNDNQVCADMKLINLEKVRDVLLHETNEVQVSDELRTAALKPLERMLELAK